MPVVNLRIRRPSCPCARLEHLQLFAVVHHDCEPDAGFPAVRWPRKPPAEVADSGIARSVCHPVQQPEGIGVRRRAPPQTHARRIGIDAITASPVAARNEIVFKGGEVEVA